MSENPYQAPKGEEKRVPAGILLTGWFAASIPAAFICGGLTCYSAGVTGELAAKAGGYEQNETWEEAGWVVGIPLALAVTVGLIILSALFFRNSDKNP